MKKFIYRGLLYALPLIIYVVAIAIVDPYYLFHHKRPFNQAKYDIGYSYDQGHRYKIFRYLNNPQPNIILGASEINVISERNIPEEGWQSLSFGGAELEESIDLFWYIAKRGKLKKVILAPEFIKFYNAIIASDVNRYSWNGTRAAQTIDLFDNKLESFIDKYTIQSTYFYLLHEVGVESGRNKPSGEKADFWAEQLQYGRLQYSNQYDENKRQSMYSSLSKIGEYCKKESIDIMVVLPIQHTDLISLEYSPEVYTIYRDYLAHLISSFGKVYYFDYPNNVSKDSESFSDPFHYLYPELYLDAIWGEDISNVIILNSCNDLQTVDSIRSSFIVQ